MTQVIDKAGLTYYTSKIKGITNNLQDQVNALKNIGRYLSNWQSNLGKPVTEPPGLNTGDRYDYKVGDYFLVSSVATSGNTNYKPNGTYYIVGSTSSTVESGEVAVGDIYVFDGTNWLLQSNTQKTINFSQIAGQPTDNTNLATALNAKVSDVQVKGTSVVTSGVANIGVAGDSSYGVVKTNSTTYGVGANADGILFLRAATTAQIDAKTTSFFPIMPSTLDYAVKVGVTTNTNVLTASEKTAATNWILPAQSAETVLTSDGTNASWQSPIVFVNYSD